MKQKHFIIILILLSLTGIMVSSISLNQHFDHITDGFKGDSFCSINEVIDCEAVDASEYSTIKGVPTAGLGLLFYLIIFVYGLNAIRNPEKKSTGLSFSILLSIGSLVVTGFMAYIASVKLEVFCILCVSMYIINILIFLILPFGIGESLVSLPEFFLKYLQSIFNQNIFSDFKPKFWGHVTFSIFFLLIGSMILFKIEENTNIAAVEAKRKAYLASIKKNQNQNQKPQMTIEERIKLHFESPQIELNTSGHPFKGNPKAKVKIVEFSDFECPFCKRAAEYFSSIMKSYEDDVAFYYINYPLDKACNPKMTRDLHKNACLAAKAAICAGSEGKFWPMHDILFENNRSISAITLPKFANKINLSWSELNQCIQSSETKAILDKDFTLANQVGVSGTPTVLINGRKVNGWTDRDFLEAILDTELNKK